MSAAGAEARPAASTGDGGGTVLAFLVEVAGGRRLLEMLRERVQDGASTVALAAPQNQPVAGQIVDTDEVRDAARSRVEVTQQVLSVFGVDAVGAVLDPDPPLALDDAVRAFDPDEILISCLAETRFGLLRRDLVEWAKSRFEAPIVHIPVRIEDDAIRWDVTHTLVVATQTVDSPELLEALKSKAKQQPHRYTIISPRSGEVTREQVCSKLARTLAALYKEEIDATGQPMSPAPAAAVENAIEHYRIDEILISTFAGQHSKWLEEGLVEEVEGFSEKPVHHIEVSTEGRPGSPPAAPGRESERATGQVA